LLARVAEQAKQLLPVEPHCSTDGCTQLTLLQHPLGQALASHRHCPLTQCCPGLHGGLGPQPQVPSRLQVSVRREAHDVQTAPFWPHGQRAPSSGQAPGVDVKQVEPEQHPAQLAAVQLLHRPSLQI
jgi:hypothetical protein